MQQSSQPMIGPSHPVRGLIGLARQISLPHEYAPERFPSFPALERTAVMGFNTPVKLTCPASTTTEIMLMRQAAWPAWATQSAALACYGVSHYVAVSPAGGTYNVTGDVIGSPFEAPLSNRLASASLVGISGTLDLPWKYPLLGVDGNDQGGSPFVYLPVGWDLIAVVYSSGLLWVGGTTKVMVSVESWQSPGESKLLLASGTITSGVTGLAIQIDNEATKNGWFRIRSVEIHSVTSFGEPPVLSCSLLSMSDFVSYTASAATAGTIAVGGTVKPSGLLPIGYPAEFQNSQMPWYSTRVTAASLLATNVTQVLNKAGTVLCGRVGPQVENVWNATSQYLSSLHPAEKAFLALESGMYTYCPPSTDMASFWDYTLNTAAGLPPQPLVRLDNDSLVNIAYFSPGAVAAELAINIDWHVEFRTSSALFQIGLSGLTLETLHQAQLSLAMSGFFFDNPDHKPILQRITAAVTKVAPTLITAAGIVHPMAGRILKGAANHLMSRKKNTTPATTSAEKSGITKKKKKAQVPKNAPKNQPARGRSQSRKR